MNEESTPNLLVVRFWRRRPLSSESIPTLPTLSWAHIGEMSYPRMGDCGERQ
jgi:hypothetical protein